MAAEIKSLGIEIISWKQFRAMTEAAGAKTSRTGASSLRKPGQMAKFRMPKLTMTTDIVIFTIRDERLEILLIERQNPPYQGKWALPGGLVEEDEDLDVCAHRELEEETKVTGVELEQLHAFRRCRTATRAAGWSRLLITHWFVPIDCIQRQARMRPMSDGSPWTRCPVWHLITPKSSPWRGGDCERGSTNRRMLLVFFPRRLPWMSSGRWMRSSAAERLDPRRFRRRVLALELIEDTGKTRPGKRRPERLYRATKRTCL